MRTTIVRILTLSGFALSMVLPLYAGEKDDEAQPKTLRAFAGEITSVEKVAKSITVRKFPVSKTFLVAVTCKITTSDQPDAALKDLKVGDKVKVKYDEEKDGLIARQIIIRGIDEEDREDARAKEKLERQ